MKLYDLEIEHTDGVSIKEGIENQIKQLVEEMESEISGSIAYMDVELMKEIANEIDVLQRQLWKIEVKL